MKAKLVPSEDLQSKIMATALEDNVAESLLILDKNEQLKFKRAHIRPLLEELQRLNQLLDRLHAEKTSAITKAVVNATQKIEAKNLQLTQENTMLKQTLKKFAPVEHSENSVSEYNLYSG